MTTVNEIYEAVMSGQLAMVSEKVQQALSEGISASTILNDGLIAAMREVGERGAVSPANDDHARDESRCRGPQCGGTARSGADYRGRCAADSSLR